MLKDLPLEARHSRPQRLAQDGDALAHALEGPLVGKAMVGEHVRPVAAPKAQYEATFRDLVHARRYLG